MNDTDAGNEYDLIIVGSGTCGATIARQLCSCGIKILLIERGSDDVLRESFKGVISITHEVEVGKGLRDMSGSTLGGSTALYFAVAQNPPLDEFRAMGIDLSRELDQIRAELPINVLPDELISKQSLRVRDAATQLGVPWNKNEMLIDLTKCQQGYSYEAKWKAKEWVCDAQRRGVSLLSDAKVTRVLVENGAACGVEYIRRHKKATVRAPYVVLSAGALSTPLILQNSGLTNLVKNGFFVDPNVVVTGFNDSVEGGENFVGCMGSTNDDGVALGDANLTRAFFKMYMLANMKLFNMFRHASSMSIGVKVNDESSGELSSAGKYRKSLSDLDQKKLKLGTKRAIEILEKAGADSITVSDINTGQAGGLISIGRDVDENLETEIHNLFVCDGSLIPENIRVAPALTLLCLGQYLGSRLTTKLA